MGLVLEVVQFALYGMLVFLVVANLTYLALIPIERFTSLSFGKPGESRSFVLFEPILIPPLLLLAWIRSGHGFFTSVGKAAELSVGTLLLSWVPVWGTMFVAWMYSRKNSKK